MITRSMIDEAKSWIEYQVRNMHCIGAYYQIYEKEDKIVCKAKMLNCNDKEFTLYGERVCQEL